MNILAIETSCDETSVALVKDGRDVLSLEIASSVFAHAEIGGVVPEIAARDHVVKMIPVLQKTLDSAGILISDIDAIAVTNGPGLIGSLLSGVVTAQTLALVWRKPLIPVHHIAGHIYANWLDRKDEVNFPCVILTASGGHNEIVLMKGHGDFEIIGETLDDAAGEAFDKVARLLGLGYPGGPAISKAALKGNRDKYILPRPMINSDNLNFSFSGLKTAVSYLVKEIKGKRRGMTLDEVNDVAACFEKAVADVLVSKLMKAVKNYKVNEIHISGGVSANTYLRERLLAEVGGKKVVRIPEKMIYCTDNAAMIAAAAYYVPRNSGGDWRKVELDLNFDFK